MIAEMDRQYVELLKSEYYKKVVDKKQQQHETPEQTKARHRQEQDFINTYYRRYL
jgi:hypothetical protein